MALNPYEVRLRVLEMAQQTEMEKFYARRDELIQRWNVECDEARLKDQNIPPMPPMPEYPTEEVIVKKAQFLGEYINNQGKQSLSE